MPISHKDFCSIARQITLQGKPIQGEAAWRTAAGRAYYAVYLATRQAIRDKYGKPQYDVLHKTLWDKLREPTNPPDVRQLGDKGASLYKWRSWADYHPTDRTIQDSDAEDRAQECEEALNLLSGVHAQLPLPAEKTF